MKNIVPLLTVHDVIEELGGNAEAAKLLGVQYNTVCNWKMFGRFPSDTYVMMQKALKMREQTAPDHLWQMRTPVMPKRKKARVAR